MSRHDFVAYRGVAVALLALSLVSCDPTVRHRVLSTVFDDVPPPGYEPPPRKPVRTARTVAWKIPEIVEPDEEEAEELPSEPLRPAIESLRVWDEALALLPRSITGGPDWVKALADGVIEPRAAIDPEVPPPPAFPIDVQMNPDSAFTVKFPHGAHTVWLQCPNCHPGVFLPKRGANEFTMSDVFAGEYCGKCHGKVAFAPEGNCVRCHTRLQAPPPVEGVADDLARAVEAPMPASPRLIGKGKQAYDAYCDFCHGEDGDGNGPAAPDIDPRARDFRKGTYKFRSTPMGTPPTDADIYRTITMGAPGTSMPAFAALPAEERWALVHYIKTFSDRFEKKKPGPSIEIPPAPEMTPEMIAEGQKAFGSSGCPGCHGTGGGGDGPIAGNLKDTWGFPVRPFDFTSGEPIRSGAEPEDFYRAFMTGIDGSPMPGFASRFSSQQAWSLVYYLRSLAAGDAAVKMNTIAADVGLAKPTPVAAGPPESRIMGNIYFPPRDWVPEIPTAIFPHWRHRIRFRCLTCHPAIFPMKTDFEGIDMAAIKAGKFCGNCHNDRTVWAPSFDTCIFCHPSR